MRTRAHRTRRKRADVHASSSGVLQRKSRFAGSQDIFEEEANRVAEQVGRRTDARSPGGCSCGGTCPKCQGKTAGATVLDAGTRRLMESELGHDFGSVRIRTDASAARSARSLAARAYTTGREISFATGEYAPHTRAGKMLLAHELTHVVQQGQAPPVADHGLSRSFPPMPVTRGMPSGAVARAENDNGKAVGASGCRKTSEAPCPGTPENAKAIEHLPSQRLVNKGSCRIFVAGVGPDRLPVAPAPHFGLDPGESGVFVPEEGSIGTMFVCSELCSGTAALEHPFSCV